MVGDLLLGLRWVLGVVFVAAGAMKIRVGPSFENSIASYGLVPYFLHRPLARLLPILEICVGASCMMGVLPTFAAWGAFVLLLAFAFAVAWSLVRGRRFECGCGTMSHTAINWGLVMRDLGLAAIAAAVALGPSGSLAVWRGSAALPSHTLPVSELVPVPMIVILMLCMIRSLSASPSVWTRPQVLGRPSDGLETRL